MKRSLLSFILALVCAGCVDAQSLSSADRTAVSTTFTNPMHKGADPWMMKHDGRYYTCASSGRGIVVTESRFMTRTETSRSVWGLDTAVLYRRGIWAPEIHFFDSRWYIYFAAGSRHNPYTAQRTYVISSDKPMGEYRLEGMVNTGAKADRESVWAIDMTVMECEGGRYAVWSGWENQERTDQTQQNLYIARMISPSVLGDRVLLSTPSESWEQGEKVVLQEGPQILHNDQGDTFVVYSTRGSWTVHYKLGMLKHKRGTDPLDLANWVKLGPVFVGAGDVYGVGHASFTTSPDDSEHWIYYHCKTDKKGGWGDRKVNLKPFTFDSNGNPQFGTPSFGPLARPSGEVELESSDNKNNR